MTHPDVLATSTARALRAPALAAGLGLAAAAVLHLRDPHDSGTYGFCPFQRLTGLPCPGCGGLRAVNDLTRGDVVGALGSNAVAVVMVAAAVVLWCVWVVRRVRGDHTAQLVAVGTRGGLAVLAGLVVFGVLRVTPWGSWLAP
ncbi:DUF2752 domain-containing protein [Aeromicrobium fastidiosum]|uniref:DUF2752 domain-containing protein n=1 Tax=Aeromicrobium fastidiosum TaxID=52699 RepID=UPI0020236F18|nr:DUF2752 domain-containing protein [Aeromicrobium fastidiosum]MCL8250305.1 DUF2752 domain-containing protein [Aeromicrobium fastidiosum]